ncbi:hypothetical protein ABIB75_001840 [Bradyrhizobium sp. GM2.2]|jgi:hypothetical protein|nr:hypothetical protein [Bradyrhizobium canariense]
MSQAVCCDRSPGERSDTRERRQQGPGYRFAHSGYAVPQ